MEIESLFMPLNHISNKHLISDIYWLNPAYNQWNPYFCANRPLTECFRKKIQELEHKNYHNSFGFPDIAGNESPDQLETQHYIKQHTVKYQMPNHPA